MPIDNCKNSFHKLANEVLEEYLKTLKSSIKRPISTIPFEENKTANKNLLKTLGLESDFSGCYVFIKGQKPFYVGISQHVIERLVSHIGGNHHNTATLAYNMAKQTYLHEKKIDKMDKKRDDAMNDHNFKKHFIAAKNLLSESKVAYVKIDNPLELYLFEVYAAMKLNTCEFNTFKTH